MARADAEPVLALAVGVLRAYSLLFLEADVALGGSVFLLSTVTDLDTYRVNPALPTVIWSLCAVQHDAYL